MRLQLQLSCAADKRPAPQGGSVPLNRRQAHCCRQVSRPPQWKSLCHALDRQQVPNTVLQTGDQGPTQASQTRHKVLMSTVMLLL